MSRGDAILAAFFGSSNSRHRRDRNAIAGKSIAQKHKKNFILHYNISFVQGRFTEKIKSAAISRRP